MRHTARIDYGRNRVEGLGRLAPVLGQRRRAARALTFTCVMLSNADSIASSAGHLAEPYLDDSSMERRGGP